MNYQISMLRTAIFVHVDNVEAYVV